MDGSQKLPQRWIATLDENRIAGRPSLTIEAALKAWLRHTRGDNGPVEDPLADQFQRLWKLDDRRAIMATIGAPALEF